MFSEMWLLLRVLKVARGAEASAASELDSDSESEVAVTDLLVGGGGAVPEDWASKAVEARCWCSTGIARVSTMEVWNADVLECACALGLWLMCEPAGWRMILPEVMSRPKPSWWAKA